MDWLEWEDLEEGTATLVEMESLGDADPRDLSQQQISQLRQYLNDDLFAFAWFVFGFQDLIPEIHGKIGALLGKWGQPGWEKLMIQIPREYFKTSLCTIANSLWQLCNDPDSPIAIFNEKQDNAGMWVRTVRDTVRSSQLFHTLYPELCPPGIGPNLGKTMPRWWKWNDDEIMLERGRIQPEASLTALGIGSASAGRHWPKIICDDLISEDAANSASVMGTVKDWLDKSVYLERPALKGWRLFACTPWAYDDIYAHALRTYDYRLYRRAALENEEGEPDVNGKTSFPQKLSTEELLAHLAKDDFGFMSQMQCQPRPGRDRSFDTGWIRWGQVDWTDPERPKFRIRVEDYDSTIKGEATLVDPAPRVVPLSQMSKMVLLDPAPSDPTEISRGESSFNGFVVQGQDAWGRRFNLESLAVKVDPQEVLGLVFKLLDKWGTSTIGIEEVSFSKIYRWWLQQEAQRRGVFVNVVKLKPGRKDKEARILGLIQGYKAGLYYFNKGETKELVKQLAEYPYSTSRDCLDAHAYDYKLGRPSAPEELEFAALQERIEETGRSGVTGY